MSATAGTMTAAGFHFAAVTGDDGRTWFCDHVHPSVAAARKCAKAELRRRADTEGSGE